PLRALASLVGGAAVRRGGGARWRAGKCRRRRQGGSTVRRPAQAWTPAVHALLRHFEQVGFTGAPRVQGFDDPGRETLDYIFGDVAVPPFPAWSTDLELLVSVATLQRAAHRAVQSFRPGEGW